VPLGIFLSGGLDSGAITSLASRSQGSGSIPAITFAFEDIQTHELQLTQKMASYAGVALSIETLNENELLADIPQVFNAMDQPSVDGVNSWYISRAARRAGWKVALSGVGGDELFAGYSTFSNSKWMQYLPVGLSFAGLFSSWFNLRKTPDAWRKLTGYISGDPPLGDAYFALRSLFLFSQIRDLLKKDVVEREPYSLWMDSIESSIKVARQYDRVGQVSWLETSQYMTSTLLRDLDSMSMAHSLEVRVPFVDHQLYETILPIAGRYKMIHKRRKPLLVNSLGAILPQELIRAQKSTFSFPFDVWLRRGLSFRVKESLFNGLGMPEIFNTLKVRDVWRNFEQGRTSWSRPWSLFVLGDWISTYLNHE
jgi:asparagine synthase (glutamine-hydrolysing)